MTKYNHAEAYCLMTYANKDRSLIERLWNSRDGVTPFVIRSVCSTGPEQPDANVRVLEHIDWRSDERRPDYIPVNGQRIFIDYGFDDFVQAVLKGRVETFWDHPELAMKNDPRWGKLGKEGAARQLALSEWRPGTPRIMTIGKDGTYEEIRQLHLAASAPPEDWRDPFLDMRRTAL